MTGIRPRIRASTRMIAVIVLACAQGAAWSQSPDEPSADGEGEALDFLFEESGTSEADSGEQPEPEETPPRTAQPYEETIPLPREPATAASTSPRPRSIEEIVVTARRTEENLQDVPVAIAAMSSDDLKREQINSRPTSTAVCRRW